MTIVDQNIGAERPLREGDDPYYAGDAIQLGEPYIIIWESEDRNNRKDLSGFSTSDVTFEVQRVPGGTADLSDSDSGVTITFGNRSDGELRIRIDAGVTSDMQGEYDWTLRLTDPSGDPDTVAEGELIVLQR